MKQLYIIHERHPRLLLFFAGWGADATPFKEYRPAGSDFMICYDYRTLHFDDSLLHEYSQIEVISWSMGVWAASHVFSQSTLPINHSIAINGTPYPIDEHRGIPPAIFHGTLNGLNGASLHKFLRRMCAGAEAFRSFLEVTPRRPLEELKDELAQIEWQANRLPVPTFEWKQAIVGSNDRIIAASNQLQAWEALQVPVVSTNDAHYQAELFSYYLQDLWINY